MNDNDVKWYGPDSYGEYAGFKTVCSCGRALDPEEKPLDMLDWAFLSPEAFGECPQCGRVRMEMVGWSEV